MQPSCDCGTCAALRVELPALVEQEREAMVHLDDPDDRAYAARDALPMVREQIHLVEARLADHAGALERRARHARRRCGSCLRDYCDGDPRHCADAAADQDDGVYAMEVQDG